MRTLKVEINCGEKTCASEKGVFCKHLSTIRFGTAWRCSLFGDELRDERGWLQRCSKCIEMEEKDG